MSKFGDEFFRRLLRIKEGLQPATQLGRRCARCRKDMSNYFLLLEPKPTDVCNECQTEIRNEEYIERWKGAKPPVYDIDKILFAPARKPFEIVRELNSKIDPCCPESLLLEPELVVRDFEEISPLIGDDFGYILALNNGVSIFLHGLRAMQAIGATRMVQSMMKIRDFAANQGVNFPNPLPDPWLCNITLDSGMERELNRLTHDLKPYDGLNGGTLEKMLVEYLHTRLEILRQRKTG